MYQRLGTLSLVLAIGCLGFAAGCPFGQLPIDLCTGVTCDAGFTCDSSTGECVASQPPDLCADVTCDAGFTCDSSTGECVASQPQGFLDADATRGGKLYDKWWDVQGVTADEPTGDHPLYPADGAQAGGGSGTWRCKECHGWDYKGAGGVYGDQSSSHYTGIAGIFGTALDAQGVFDKIKDDHGFGAAGLADTDIWDLSKFVLEGLIDTDGIIDAGGAFTGSADAGGPTYDSACAACHGSDGLTPPPGHPEFNEYPGLLADENPWEVQHKIRFGQPGTAMPPQADLLTTAEVGDLGAYLQTLPTEAGGGGDGGAGGDATEGQAFYTANNCGACHADDASGGFGPSLVGESASEIFDRLSGAATHPGGTVDGVTQQDADDVAAWLATL